MSIFNLYSKRQKKLRGEESDVYVYDDLPDALKVQIIHIWTDVLGNDNQYYQDYPEIIRGNVKSAYKLVVDIICREYGLFELPTANKHNRMYLDELANYFLQESDIEKSIDIIELSFKLINTHTRKFDYLCRNNSSQLADKAIEELNCRLKEHGIGYQFVENEIIKMDSELIHIEVVKPALKLLNQKKYQGAQEEFLGAYEHYKNGKNKEALNDCLKAFESTMKAICEKRGWTFSPTATSKSLIDICFSKGLIPSFWQSQFTSLRSMLQNGISTCRNKASAHGQGTTPVSVPDYLVAYMLHMTASTLVFLTTAEKEL